MPKEVILQVKDLVKEFPQGPQFPKLFNQLTRNKFQAPNIRILDGISFDLVEDMSLALLGPNGSGKTTLLKTLATLYYPDEGDIIVKGKSIHDSLSEIREDIVFVSPDMQFLNKLTLRQTLEYFAKITNGDEKLGMEFIEELNLSHMLDKKLESFSVGQKAITRLCVGLQKDPEFLFLDEVTNGLDARRKQTVITFLEKQTKERTIILVDHDAGVLDRLCNYVLLLRRGGKVDRMLTMDELLHGFDYMFDILLIPKRELTTQEIERIHDRYEVFGETVRFFVKDVNELTEVEQRIVEFKDFIEFRVSGISIDDVVLKWFGEQKGD